MSLQQYIFSDIFSLGAIAPLPTHILEPSSIPDFAKILIPETNGIVFHGRQNQKKWAFYRLDNDQLEIVSPFGCCRLPTTGLNSSNPITLVSIEADGEADGWDVLVDAQWRDRRGIEAGPHALKARPLPDGSFEPLHSSMAFRGINSKPDFWTVVLLPSPAQRVYEQNGCARIDAGGRTFALPPGSASEHILSGSVQWGLPDETGFFALQAR